MLFDIMSAACVWCFLEGEAYLCRRELSKLSNASSNNAMLLLWNLGGHRK